MHPAATLFLDVCVQRDLGPGGGWPLVTSEQMGNIVKLFVLAGELAVRQGGIVCVHTNSGAARAPCVPGHCRSSTSGCDRPPDCLPRLPIQVWQGHEESEEVCTLDRSHAIYVSSGCGAAPDATTRWARGFGYLIAGVRDVVLFGSGIEYGMDYAIEALLRRRVRTHVVLDAAGSADGTAAQLVVARWKRRAVDGVTVGTLRHLLIPH